MFSLNICLEKITGIPVLRQSEIEEDKLTNSEILKIIQNILYEIY